MGVMGVTTLVVVIGNPDYATLMVVPILAADLSRLAMGEAVTT